MGPLMPRVTARTYNAQQEHITHAQGRYIPLTDGSTDAESDNNIYRTLETDTPHSQMGPLMSSDNKNIEGTLETDTPHSQMGPLMPRLTTR